MLRKTIEIATPGTRLSVAHRQLVIERLELPKATVPIEDLGFLVVDDGRGMDAAELRARLSRLMERGRDLDVAIAALTGAPGADALQLLRLRDEMQMVRDRLIPDIIA